jgi:hypothetical protein
MNLHEHLGQLVRYAPPGTLVPVDSLAELLRTYACDVEPRAEAPEEVPQALPRAGGLSLGEVAERFTRQIGGEMKTVQDGTVRKWARVGLRGVRLRTFRVGRHLRVLEEDFEAFVRELSAPPATGRPMTPVRKPEIPQAPGAEIDTYLALYRQPPNGETAPSGGRRRGHAGPPSVEGRRRRA